MEGTQILLSKRSRLNRGEAHSIQFRNPTFEFGQVGWTAEYDFYFWSADSVNNQITANDWNNYGSMFPEQVSTQFRNALLYDTYYTLSFETTDNNGTGYLEILVDQIGSVYSGYGNSVHTVDLIVYSGVGASNMTIINQDGWTGSVKNFVLRQNLNLSPLALGYWSYEPVGYLDVYDDLAIPITYQSQDIESLSTRNSSYSKTIGLPATGNNKKLLGHLDSNNVDFSNFNPNEKVVATVIRNGIPVFEGYMQLLSIGEVNENNDTNREFEVRIFDDKQNIFKEFGKRSLQELDYTELDHELRLSAITDNWASGSTWTKGYHYPLYYSQLGKYELKYVYPAFFVRDMVDRMFANVGYTYEFESRIENDINRLLIPYTGEKPRKPTEQIETSKTIAENTGTTSFFSNGFTSFSINTFSYVDLEISNEIQDGQNGYDPSPSLFVAPLTGEFRVEFSASATIVITSNADTGGQPLFDIDDTSNIENAFVSIALQRNGVDLNGGSSIAWFPPTTSPEGTYNQTFKVSTIVNLNQGDTIDFKGIWKNKIKYDINSLLVGYIDMDVDYDNIHIDISQLGGDLVEGDLVRLNNYLPDLTQADLLKNLIKMFNLQLDYSNSSNHIRFITRDSYYSGTTVYDWEDLLDRDSEVQTIPLNEVQSKRLIFTYKENDDPWNDNYTKATGEVYGEYVYDFNNDFYDEDEKIELSFVPTPVVKNRIGLDNLYVPAISSTEPKSPPRILYINEPLSTQDDIIFLTANFGSTGFTENTVSASEYYPCLHIGQEVLENTANLNFGEVDSTLLYENFDMSDATLFNRYYSRTMNQIATGRLKVAYFHLTEKEINDIKDNLNAKIWCFNEYWTINKIEDYNAANDGLTKVELVLYEDKELRTNFKRFQAVPTTQQAVVENDLGTLGFNFNGGINNTINGFFNYLTSNTNIVNGWNNTVYSTGNTIFGDNNYVSNNINNAYIYGNNITATTPDTVYFFSTGTTIGPSGATYYNFVQMNSTAFTINNVVSMTTGGTSFYDNSVLISNTGLTIGPNIYFSTGGSVSIGTGLNFCLTGEPQVYEMLQYSEDGCWNTTDLYLRVFSGDNSVINFNGGSGNTIADGSTSLYSGFIGGFDNYLGGPSPYSFWMIACTLSSGDTSANDPSYITMLSTEGSITSASFLSTMTSARYAELTNLSKYNFIGGSNYFNHRDTQHCSSLAGSQGGIYNSLFSGVYNSNGAVLSGGVNTVIIGGESNYISGSTNGLAAAQVYALTSSSRNAIIIGGENNNLTDSRNGVILGSYLSNNKKNNTTLVATSGLTVDESSVTPEYTTYFDHTYRRGANYEEAKFIASNYSAQTYDSIIVLTSTTISYTVYLPSSVDNTNRLIQIKSMFASTVGVSVGGDLIDGSATFALSAGDSFKFISDGVGNWYAL